MDEINQILEDLKTKIEKLVNSIEESKLHFGNEEEYIAKMLEMLSLKIDKLTKDISEKYYVRENLLTYIIGAFAGGLIMGLSLYKRLKD